MFRFFSCFGWFLLCSVATSAQEYSYHNRSILDIIQEIESNTDYRFLYREALVTNISVSFEADQSQLFTVFEHSLTNLGLGLQLDHDRKQAIIFKSSNSTTSSQLTIGGYIVDANTGERLPFATISWRERGEITGVISDASGRFSLTTSTEQPTLHLLISYIGYTNQQLSLSIIESSSLTDITIRLKPKSYDGKEIVVQGVNFYSPGDTVLHGLMKVGSFSPLGESNAVRSLQTLPAVSMNTAVNDGINIRGSSSDGFQVLLDGQTLYSQSHLFGLLDAMNPDVLRSSGFYYDITPAQFQAPLGGTLSLITRTGSLNAFSSTIGLSNTAISSTIEGPLKKGASSFIFSGRWSYMDELNWFNNSEMIEYGLDVNRPADLFVDPRLQNRFIRSITLDEIEVQSTNASFYDLHGKVYTEFKNGNQFIISGYLGRDDASQEYLRSERNFITTNKTTNNWNNGTISAIYNNVISPNIYSATSLGYTQYSSRFQKDDFAFPLRSERNGTVIDSVIVLPLSLENELWQIELEQNLTIPLSNGQVNFGLNYTDFDVRYTELASVRESFISKRTSQLVDVYGQWDVEASDQVAVSAGSRLHYFSNGQFWKYSPRLKLSIKGNEVLDFSLGFSRNYQFINRLAFYNINSNDFWILSNEDQPPSSVNLVSAGIYYQAKSWIYIQLEGYLKQFENLRLHELNSGSVSRTFKNQQTPWFYQNEGRANGLELLVKNWYKDVVLSTAYTYSIAELKNELINGGDYFFASWDRRHQLTSILDWELSTGINLLMAWTFGTGILSRAEFIAIGNNANRLPNYSRFDVSLNYKRLIKGGTFVASFSIYNAFDRNNAWYSERKRVTVTTLLNQRQGAAITHIYDLGLQPSFNLKISF